MLWTLAFWKGAAERAIKTFAQALIATLGVTGIGFGDVNWPASLSAAGLAALASILTSVINPSFTAGPDTTEVYDPTVAILTEDNVTPDGDEDTTFDGDPEATETEADRDTTDDTPGRHAAE